MPRLTDKELAASLAEDHDAQERSRRQRAQMNALIRGGPPPPADDDTADPEEYEHGTTGEPADFSAVLRRRTGRPYKSRKNKEQE